MYEILRKHILHFDVFKFVLLLPSTKIPKFSVRNQTNLEYLIYFQRPFMSVWKILII